MRHLELAEPDRREAARKAKNPAECGVFRGIGRGRIRTFEGISHQIYSLTPLATWVHARGWSSSPGVKYMAVEMLFKGRGRRPGNGRRNRHRMA